MRCRLIAARLWRLVSMGGSHPRRDAGEQTDPLLSDVVRVGNDLDQTLDDMELILLTSRGGPALVEARLRRLGLMTEQPSEFDWSMVEAMKAACERCPHWRRCARSLMHDVVEPDLDDICLNAGAIERLLRKQRGKRPGGMST